MTNERETELMKLNGKLYKQNIHMRAALSAIVAIFSDREKFVMEGIRAFGGCEKIAQDALDEASDDNVEMKEVLI